MKDENATSCANSPRSSSPNCISNDDAKRLIGARLSNSNDVNGNPSKGLTNVSNNSNRPISDGFVELNPNQIERNCLTQDSARLDASFDNDDGVISVGRLSPAKTSARDGILQKYEKVAELLMTAGSYMTAIEMTWHAIDVEKRELGAR